MGPSAHFVDRCLDAYDHDLKVRCENCGSFGKPSEIVATMPFRATDDPAALASFFSRSKCFTATQIGGVVLSAVRVRHEPVVDAVAYRVDTPRGSVVVSGDTRACETLERLAEGCDVFVCEACYPELLPKDHDPKIVDYHTTPFEVGQIAKRANVKTVVLTHLIPPLPARFRGAGARRFFSQSDQSCRSSRDAASTGRSDSPRKFDAAASPEKSSSATTSRLRDFRVGAESPGPPRGRGSPVPTRRRRQVAAALVRGGGTLRLGDPEAPVARGPRGPGNLRGLPRGVDERSSKEWRQDAFHRQRHVLDEGGSVAIDLDVRAPVRFAHVVIPLAGAEVASRLADGARDAAPRLAPQVPEKHHLRLAIATEEVRMELTVLDRDRRGLCSPQARGMR